MPSTPLLRSRFLAIVCLFAIVPFAQAKPHVVLVAGTLHYSPELTLPAFAEELERFGFGTTVVIGRGDPEKQTTNVLPGIEALDDADTAIFLMRFLKLPDEEWAPIERYLKAGKPVIGLRTATHSFKYGKEHPRFEWNDGFGRRAMGTPYVVHQQGATEISVIEKRRQHPILANVAKSNWISQGSLYLTRLEPGCIPLVIGTGEGRMRLLERDIGPVQVNTSEADIVAWAWENEWGGKVFGTSFGDPTDFGEEAFTRMLLNSVFWSLDMPVPSADQKVSTWKIKRADK
jgi:hypothetical protein